MSSSSAASGLPAPEGSRPSILPRITVKVGSSLASEAIPSSEGRPQGGVGVVYQLRISLLGVREGREGCLAQVAH